MPQTFYVENDEEIISVIGRLRRSPSQENFFVFPKRALVLQSIINLRLFGREAEKLGKKVVIVTQDEAGKVMAEKAGLAAEHYSDDPARQTKHLELTPSEEPKVVKRGGNESAMRFEDIGSNDFFAVPNAPAVLAAPLQPTTPVPPTGQVGQTLRIRNATPEKQTSLNSKRFSESGDVSRVAPISRPLPPQAAPSFSPPVQNFGRPAAEPDTREALQAGREERLKSFLSAGTAQSVPTKEPAVVPRVSAPSVTKSPATTVIKAKGIFLFFGVVSVLSLLGVAVFLFMPKAEVHVIPYRAVQTVDLQFEGRTDADMKSDSTVLPVRILEKEQTVRFSREATGTAPGIAQKARGTITITNAFSTDPQPLVATTRFESPEGKVYRLVEGVTVPGMKSQPGTVEASVVADQTGIDYNIAATTFTIPGFKGSPKYDKFTGRSGKPMSGGSDGSGSKDQKTIAKSDLDQATTEALKNAKEGYLTQIAPELLPGEKVLEESIEIVPLKDALLPLAGTVASSFEYENAFRVRGFVFSEESIKQKILSREEEKVGGVPFRPVSVILSYGESLPDYEKQSVRLKTEAMVTSESVIDRERLLTAILGKDETGIDEALHSFPEINKLSIVFRPRWLTSTVPSAASRVVIMVDPGEE